MEQEVYYGEIQSGHLEQVGYDTYCNLLDEVVKEMKGIDFKKDFIPDNLCFFRKMAGVFL